MTDLWSFLLQTLTASGAAVLLLVVKLMLQDKLSPRWQFAVWGVLGMILLIPAGFWGRYVLINWPMYIEVVKSALTGEFGTLTKVLAPVPLPSPTAPETVWDWLYLIYIAGVVLLLARYVVSYVRLRLALKKGRRVRGGQVRTVAEEYGLPACAVVEVDGLPTAFICGVFKPVLALPAGAETDGKIILHELLHLKHRDVVWGWVIAFFRCVHWCNPLIWWCADWAGNDLESLCDQRVLERLEGEDRRDYGRILLSMADERYARTPGTSSASNGGENVRRRIEAIARFKRYPAGMALASVCVVLVLAVPLVVGVRAETVPERGSSVYAMASARTVWCTTPMGAFDTYAKAILTGNLPYRAMCAPLDQQNELAAVYGNESRWGIDWLMEHNGLTGWPRRQSGYRVFNLEQLEDGSCEGLLVVELSHTPEGQAPARDDGGTWLAIQPLRAEKEEDRWVILPQGDFYPLLDKHSGTFSTFPVDTPVPAKVYEAQAGDFTIREECWTIAALGEEPGSGGNLVPQPHSTVGQFSVERNVYAIYTGNPAKKAEYKKIAVSSIPYSEDEARPKLRDPRTEEYSTGSCNNWALWSSHPLREDWLDEISLNGGGTTFDWERDGDQIPDRIAADLYLNDELAAELTLLPVEGSA